MHRTIQQLPGVRYGLAIAPSRPDAHRGGQCHGYRGNGRNLEQYKISSVDDVRRIARDIVAAPAADWEDFNLLKDYLYDNVYKKAQVCIMNEKGKLVVRRIFEHLEKAPEMLPGHWRTRYTQAGNRADKRRVLTDYISGMTDRYAMDLYQMMFSPYEKVMFEFRER